MFILNGSHPAIPGNVVKLFHTRPAAEREGIVCLRIIGDYLAKNYRACYGAEHHNAADWEDMRDDEETAFFTMNEFLVGFDPEDADEQEWLVEISELQPMDQSDPTAVFPAVLETTGKGLDIPVLFPGNKLSVDMARVNYARLDVQPLDPADLVVSTLVGNLASIWTLAAGTIAIGDDNKAELLDVITIEAEKAIAAGQAWLDKARPIGRIADDVVRLAGIIVAGVDLHASLSEAMDQHIYDEGDEREPDCGYQAVLDAWTEALAGITVTTPAPAT